MQAAGANIIDLFSGCGGFSLGAELAGCHTLAAVDIDPDLQSAYALNFPHTSKVQASVADLDLASWQKLIGKVRPDGIIGGPPCQGFSRIGKRSKEDPRNSLIGHFYRQIKILRPKFFVMENVEGLLDDGNREVLDAALEQVKSHYRILGPFVVDASEYGAATSRRRVIVIGYDPDELRTLSEQNFAPVGVKKATVRDAIEDLPAPIGPSAGEEFGWGKYPKIDKRTLSAYAKLMRRAAPANLGWAKAVLELDAGRVSGLFRTEHTEAVAKRFSKVAQGKSDAISKCPRLSWEGLCPTLRAGTGSDKGSFQSIRPLHPSRPRVITVREAARLQGFPDWFVFHPTKWHSFRMIGNSVSPFVSRYLLSKLLQEMDVAIAA